MKRRLLLSGLLAPATLRAQDAPWPSRGVTVIVPFAPGSSSDIIARATAPVLSAALGQPFVVENRPGATGEVGARQVIRSAPDGHMLMHAPISTWAINVALRPNLGYDPVTQLTRISQTVRTPNVLVVNPQKVPVRDLPSFIAWLKANPREASYSSSGIGSSDHLTGAMFALATGLDLVHVPFTGGAPATTAVIAGDVAFSFQNLGSIVPHIRDNRVRSIFITSQARHPLLPEVPVAGEVGLSDFVVYSWQALGGPGGMAPALAARVHAAFRTALLSREVKARMDDIGFDVVASTPAEFAAFQAGEIERWSRVVRAGNIKAE